MEHARSSLQTTVKCGSPHDLHVVPALGVVGGVSVNKIRRPFATGRGIYWPHPLTVLSLPDGQLTCKVAHNNNNKTTT